MSEEQIIRELERILDENSLDIVMGMLSEICYLKAEHIRSDWQDVPLAKAWEKAGRKLDTLSFPEIS